MKMKKILCGFSNFILIGILLSSFLSCSKNDDRVSVEKLKCEYLENPIGIDKVNPRLSWELLSSKNNIEQKAYQIIAASSLENLNKNIGDLWDSKKVNSSSSIQIKYSGYELKSRQRVFWKVKIWDNSNNESKWSNTGIWEMGLLNQSDWLAKWVGKDEQKNVIVGQRNPAIYLRKNFTIKSAVKNARIYITGLGYYENYLNGKKVSDYLLSPNQTNYDKRQNENYEGGRIANMLSRVLYNTFDVTNDLKAGENVISVILGNGWYYQNERDEYLPISFNTSRLFAQLEIEYDDGTISTIVSDESWKLNTGPIVDNNLYHGEIYDKRLEEDNWNLVSFDDSKWSNAKILRTPEGKLNAQMSPPDRVIKNIKPVSFLKLRQDTYKYDFGTMFSGWVKIKVKGSKGDTLKLNFYEDSGNSFEQTDTYILNGEELETWEPKFTWHAFRYVEIVSNNIELNIGNIEGRIVNTDVSTAGNFESSNELFNIIENDYKKTQTGNMHGGVPSDCPHRERRGYTGDGQISAQAAIYNFDMQSFYTKWLNDISDAQNKVTGYVPNTVPYHGGGGGTPWGSAYIIIPWYMYLYYGDIQILSDHYIGMKKYLDYLNSITDKEGLIIENELGEWVPPTATEIPPSLVSSAYYYYDLILISKIADVLSKSADAKNFNEKAEKVKAAFNKRYFVASTNNYSIGRQGANVFPLAFGLVPDKFVEKVFSNLSHNIEVNTDGHFDTGMMATPYLLEVLTKYGRPDLAYTIMNRRDFPSFGYNIERGATSIWETWLGHDSHSHPMFGSVCAWFFQALGGILPDPENPGFKHIIIKPVLVSDLDYARTDYHSIYGEIKTDWVYSKGNLDFNVSIPPNTNAEIYLPGDKSTEYFTENSEVKFYGSSNGTLQFSIPSGSYKIIVKGIDNFIKSPMVSIPVIDPADSILFAPDSVNINIRQYSKNSEIRYTIDGSEPKSNSLLFTKPFSLNKSTVVKAKVFRTSNDFGKTKTNRIVFLDSIKNGLSYKYYVGAWHKLPDFTKLKPQKTGNIYDINLNEFEALDDKFGIIFTGLIEITHKGKYTFYLTSNDGSKLWLDEKLVVNADDLHGFSGNSGSVDLDEGKHLIQVNYFQAGGGKGLRLEYEGPKNEKQIVPANIYFKK